MSNMCCSWARTTVSHRVKRFSDIGAKSQPEVVVSNFCDRNQTTSCSVPKNSVGIFEQECVATGEGRCMNEYISIQWKYKFADAKAPCSTEIDPCLLLWSRLRSTNEDSNNQPSYPLLWQIPQCPRTLGQNQTNITFCIKLIFSRLWNEISILDEAFCFCCCWWCCFIIISITIRELMYSHTRGALTGAVSHTTNTGSK